MTAFATMFSLATFSSLSPVPAPVVQTRSVAADEYPVPISTYREAWDRIIVDLLAPWADGQIELDDDLLPPSPASLRVAIDLARELRDHGFAAPTDVLPSGNGGVWLEHRRDSTSSQIEVLRDGTVEYSSFEGNTLVGSNLLPPSVSSPV